MKKVKLPEFSQNFISEIKKNLFYKNDTAAYRQPASHRF